MGRLRNIMALPTEGSFFRQIGEKARKLDRPAQEAITGQLQAGVGQAQQPLGAGQIQAAAGQVAAQRGQAAVQARQQAAPQVAAQAARTQQVGERERQQALFDRALELERTVRDNEQRLYNLDRTLGNDLYTQNMQFQEDELGRAFLNDRQLADYALISAKTEEDWLNYEQTMTQLSKKRMQVLDAAYKKIKQALTQDWQAGEQQLDQQHKKQLTLAAAELERKKQEEQAKAANRASMFSAGGLLLGAAAAATIIGSGGTLTPLAAAGVAALPSAGQAGGTLLGTL